MVFHPFHQRVDGFTAEVVFAASDQRVGLVHEQHAIERLVHQIIGFFCGVADVLANEAEAVGLDEVTFL